jgi:drug/metabolite transporter (DMT)-like permease
VNDLAASGLGLSAAISWGTGDFCGGVVSKRTNVFGAVAVSHAVGLTLFAVAALITREPFAGPDVVWWGIAAGISGGLALVAFYRALAIGRMSIVAPMSAVITALIPALVGIATQGAPGMLQLIGFLVAFAAVPLISSSGGAGDGRRGLVLAALSGVGFGLFLLTAQRAGRVSPLWALTFARMTSVLFIGALAVFTQRNWAPGVRELPWVFGAGLGDAVGNLAFVLATHLGRLDVASVLASLYPASTVILARVVLKENMTRVQLAGVGAALLAVVLIAA